MCVCVYIKIGTRWQTNGQVFQNTLSVFLLFFCSFALLGMDSGFSDLSFLEILLESFGIEIEIPDRLVIS